MASSMGSSSPGDTRVASHSIGSRRRAVHYPIVARRTGNEGAHSVGADRRSRGGGLDFGKRAPHLRAVSAILQLVRLKNQRAVSAGLLLDTHGDAARAGRFSRSLRENYPAWLFRTDLIVVSSHRWPNGLTALGCSANSSHEIRDLCLAAYSARPAFGERLHSNGQEGLGPRSDRGGRLFEGVTPKEPSKDRRLGLLLAAAQISFKELAEGKAGGRGTPTLQFVHRRTPCAFERRSESWNVTTVAEGPDATYRVSFAPGSQKKAIWDPGFFNKILAPESLKKQKSLRDAANLEGFGGVVVGIHKPDEPPETAPAKSGGFGGCNGNR